MYIWKKKMKNTVCILSVRHLDDNAYFVYNNKILNIRQIFTCIYFGYSNYIH